MRNLKKLLPFVVFLLALATLSSCNRGMGCPNNFSIEKAAVDVIKVVPSILIKE